MSRSLRLTAILLLATHLGFAQQVPPPQQESVIVPGENLVADGIPPIPTSLAAAVAPYTRFYESSPVGWQPTKRELLIGRRMGGSLQLFGVETPGGENRRLTFFPSGVDYVYPHPKASHYVINRDAKGDGNYQLYKYDLTSAQSVILTDGKSRNVEPVWSRTGERIVYGSTRRNGKDMDLYMATVAEPAKTRLLMQSAGKYLQTCDWSPDERQVLVREYVTDRETYLWTVDTESGAKKPLTPQAGSAKIFYDCGQFSGNGKGIYLVTDRESEWRRLAYFELATGQFRYLLQDIKADIEEFELSPDGKTLAFVTNEEGIGRLHLLDTQTEKELSKPVLPVGIVSKLVWHSNSTDLSFSFTSARSSADSYSLNTQTGKVERWTKTEKSGLNTESFAEAELVRWQSFDERMISGFLYRPPAKWMGKRPVIIDIHGGPDEQARPTFIGQEHYLLNELGVAIIYPNVRGSSGYGKSFLTLDDGMRREDSVKDIGALLDWIKTQSNLDSDRVLVRGVSYGGYLALSAAHTYSDRLRACISDSGPSNLVTFLENTADWRRDLRRAEYGDERDPKLRDFLNRIAPRNNVGRIKQPIFIVQGANDPRVPASESEQMVAALEKRGTRVWYLLARDEGHVFAKGRNQDYQFYSSVFFIREFLLK